MKTNTKTSTNSRSHVPLVGIVLAIALLAVGPGLLAQAGDAKAILKAMSDYVGNQQTIELRFDSAIEVVTPELEKIQFTNSGEALVSRPD